MEHNFTISSLSLIKDTVCSFWQVHRCDEPSINETIIPKGVIEIIFNLDPTPIHALVNNQPLTMPRCFLQGYSTAPIHLQLANSQTLFGVVLNPCVVKHIFHFPPRLFANNVFDLTSNDTAIYSLWHQLGANNNFNERVTTFTSWLIKRLPQLSERENAFNQFLHSDNDSNISVTALANLFCYSSKQLSRKIFELTGMNTEQTLLYKKYLRAIHLIHSSELSLTEIAYSSHFADQSHFIKTFKTLCQFTPHEYLQRKSNIVGHIFENVH